MAAHKDLLHQVWVGVVDADKPGGRHLAAVLVGVALGDVEDDGLRHDGDGVVVGQHDELGHVAIGDAAGWRGGGAVAAQVALAGARAGCVEERRGASRV